MSRSPRVAWALLALAALAACDEAGPAGDPDAGSDPSDAASDAAVDAADPDWPVLATVPVGFEAPGLPSCDRIGPDHVGVGTYTNDFNGNPIQVRIGLDAAMVGTTAIQLGFQPTCTVAVTADGGLIYGFVGAVEHRFFSSSGASIEADRAVDVVAADPGGGALLASIAGSFPLRVRRVTAAFAIEPSFPDVRLDGAPVERVVQGGTAAPIVTVRVADRIHRLDLRTGAFASAFGGTAGLALGVAPADLLAIAPLPALGVALVERSGTVGGLNVHRLAADGTRTMSTATLPFAVIDVIGDDAGGAIVSMAADAPDVVRLVRLDLATAALDPSFGTNGRASIRMRAPDCSAGFAESSRQHARLRGRHTDGRLVFRTYRGCTMTGQPRDDVTSYHSYAP